MTMNDPLRDNRIFPEEMQEHPQHTNHTPSLTRWLRAFMLLVILGIVAFFVYQYLTTRENVSSIQEEEQRFIEESQFFNAMQEQRGEVDPIDRALKIQNITASFNNQ